MGNAVPEVDEDNQIVGYVGTITDITERKMIEDALRESENIFNQFLLHSPIYIYFKDHNGRPLRLSKNFEQLVGMPIEEQLGKTMYELFPTDLAKKMIEDDLKVLHEGKLIEVEELYNGRHFTTIKFPIHHEGKALFLAGYTIDITERKKNEMEIRMLANALKSINDCVTITNLDNKITFISQSFLSTYGYTEEELIGQKIKIVDSPNNPTYITPEILETTLHGGWQGELLNIKKDGTEFPIHLSTTIINDEHNNPISMIGVARDITLRKLHEAELIKLNQAVIQSPVEITITDLNGNIEYVNPKAVEMSGYSKEELLGKNPRIFSSGELPKEEYKRLWETITSGKEWRGEFHNKKKNGEFYWVSASIIPIISEKGKIINYLGVKEDITEKKQIINELICEKEKAESANKLKDAFIANISHEIRTPLTGILGMTSIIYDSYPQFVREDEERIFASIEKSSKRLITTVDKILNFSLLQIGDFPVNKSNVSLTSVIQTIVCEYNPLATAKSIRINFKSYTDDDIVFGDANSLQTSFGNIIDNAIKFTDTGSVDIKIYRNEQSKLYIEISDSGEGISEEYLPHLFEAYSQEGVGYSRAYEGLGLGLAIVKKLLGLNRAIITAKSKKGEGSVFIVCFEKQDSKQEENMPVISKDIKTRHPNLPKVAADIKPAILVVEDDEVNQLFIEAILQKEYNVEMALNAAKAYKLFTSRSFDLILMDISLKEGIDGLELTKVIRVGNVNPNIPIIAVTGHAFPEDRRKAKEAGCDDYLVKPFQSNQLIEKIRALFGL